MSITLFQHQNDAITDTDRLFTIPNTNAVCTVLPTGTGKCHGINTPILMFDGSIKMIQNIKVGELLMGPDSKPRTVLNTITGVGKLYKVTPVKGDSYVVNENHILSLKQTGLSSNPKFECQKGKGDIVNISITDYINSSNNFKHTHKGWRIGVEWDKKPINEEILPPYLLGLWLGDGTSRRPDITTADVEISEYIKDYVEKTKHSLRVSTKPENKASTYHMSRGELLHELKRKNLINNKHIPDDYKTTSRDIRLQVLAGILDSDGYLSKSHYDVVFKVKTLAEDLVFLSRSLGFAAYMKPCKKTCTNTGAVGDYYRITISGDVSVIPTIVERHYPYKRLQKKSVLVTGLTVTEYSEDFYFGVSVDSDHLYLLGDFTVTHNSLTIADYCRKYYRSGQITMVFAHRDVLISQLSEALCKMGVPHSFLCADKTRRDITNRNLELYGDSYYDEFSPIIVSSIPTFNARLRDGKLSAEFLSSVKWWLCDECHHISDGNQWHNCLSALTNSHGIGFTATPIRGDKKGLGSWNDGIFDQISTTVNTFDLIKQGRLSPYKVFCTGRVDITGVSRDKNGELNNKQLYIKTQEAGITGSAVDHYLKHLAGKPVITFCVNIDHAKEVANEFNLRGVPSVAVSSKSPLSEREAALRDMREGRILNLVNVDLFGEGYDCPAIAGVIMLRRTTSFSLYKQQFGRMLRMSDGKLYGVLLDHVGNTQYFMQRFNLKHPHDDPEWTLERLDDKKKSTSDDDDPINDIDFVTCGKCEFFGIDGEDFIDGVCPECGYKESEDEKVARVREIKTRDGVLVALDNSMIDELIARRSEMLKPVQEFAKSLHPGFQARYAAINNHAVRLSSLDVLRHWIQQWSEKHWKDSCKPIGLVQTDFEIIFGTNILTAQTMTAKQMQELSDRIQQDMRKRAWV